MDTPDGVAEASAPLAWSFSRLTEYEKCPRWAYLAYVEKRPKPETIDRTHADRGVAVHLAAESYIKGEAQQLDPALEKVKDFIEICREQNAKGLAEVEEEWAFDLNWQPCNWFGKTTWLRLKLDVLLKWPDSIYEIVDWKTGKRFGNEVKHSQQGLLYAIAAFMRYPEMQRARIRFSYVDEGYDKPREYDRVTVMRMLPTWDERARKFTFAETWPVRPNQINCRFCPYSPNNGGDKSCPAGVEVSPTKSSRRSR